MDGPLSYKLPPHDSGRLIWLSVCLSAHLSNVCPSFRPSVFSFLKAPYSSKIDIFNPIFINVGNINSESTGCQLSHFMIVLIPYINLLNLSWIENVHFLRNIEPLSNCQWIFTKLGAYIDIVEIWFLIANGQIS